MGAMLNVQLDRIDGMVQARPRKSPTSFTISALRHACAWGDAD